jgi:hypothetical protein
MPPPAKNNSASFKAAKADTGTSGHGQPVGSPKKGCAQSQRQKCDFDDLLVTEATAQTTKVYERKNGKWAVKGPDPEKKDRKVSVRGAEGSKIKNVLEVVAGPRNSTPPTQVKAKIVPGSTGFGCGKKHGRLGVSGPLTNIVRDRASKEEVFPVWRGGYAKDESGAVSRALWWIAEKYWTLNIAPQIWTVSGEACGLRTDGKQPVAHASFDVYVYPAEQYTLKLVIPPLHEGSKCKSDVLTLNKDKKKGDGTSLVLREQSRSQSTKDRRGEHTQETGSSKVETSGKRFADSKVRTSETSTLASGSVRTAGNTRTVDFAATGRPVEKRSESLKLRTGADEVSQEGDGDIKWDRGIEVDGVKLEFACNGVDDSATVKITEVIAQIRGFEKAFEELMDAIKKMPSIGWKYTSSLSFVAGELALAWGWQDYSDHRVVFAWEAGIDLKLIDGKFTASFGVECFAAVAVAELELSGTLTLKASVSRNKPDQPLMPHQQKRAFEGVLAADVRGRAEIGAGWAKFKRQAGGRTGLEVKAELKADQQTGLSVHLHAAMLPLAVYIQSKDVDQPQTEDVYELLPERKALFEAELPPKNDASKK